MVLEFRLDPLKGSLVVIANERALRPMGPGINCPFCPGAEKVTPPTKLALPSLSAWKVRCFDNAFAIVKHKGKFSAIREQDFFYKSAAYGEHEVIVETSDHHQLYQDIENPVHQQLIFDAYKRRVAALMKMKGTQYVLLFKNHGRLAGASIEHEHSQLLSLPFLPPIAKQEVGRAVEYRKRTGRCITCDILEREKENALLENDSFIAICPSFARFPFEIWIIAKSHKSTILQFNEIEGGDFVALLRASIKALFRVSKDYNVVYHNNFSKDADAHFHAEIYPRPNIWAGVELGTGVTVNTKTEKDSLAALKVGEYASQPPAAAATAKGKK